MKARANGIEVNYELSGREGGPAVVLHHPLATTLAIWDELTAALAPRYRVLRFDARGHGHTEAPAGPYSFETLAADVVALMDAVGMGRALYLGLSMGGMVGQYLGLLNADRFQCLILVSTSSRVPPEMGSTWDARIAAARADGMKSQVPDALARWVSPEARRSNPALVARLSRMIENTPVEGYIGWGQAIKELNVTDRLPAIRLPTRVIVGELDPATPVAGAETIHKQIPGSELIIMPGVSHMLCAEAPDAFHGHVIPFLDRVAQA